MTEKNEFKISTLRNFGSEQFSFNAVIHSEKTSLSENEIINSVNNIDTAIKMAFVACQEREIGEMHLVADLADRRTAEITKRDESLKKEMEAKISATNTLKGAQKLSDKITAT